MLMNRIAMNASRDAVRKPCPYSLTVLESATYEEARTFYMH
jgi:hypothetical protein